MMIYINFFVLLLLLALAALFGCLIGYFIGAIRSALRDTQIAPPSSRNADDEEVH